MVERIVKKHESKVHRLLEIVPGLFTWAFILSPIWLGILYPPALVYLLIIVTIYWMYLSATNAIGAIKGYLKYKREIDTNWMERCRQLNFDELPDKETLPPSLSETKHLILIPVVNEPYEVIKPSIDSILDQSLPNEQITLVYTAEEKYADQVRETIDRALGDRKKELDDFMFFVHPAGIEGEAKGDAGANRTWGGRHAVEKLTQKGEDVRNFIFTTIDSDHVLHPHFFARTTHLYLTSDRRDHKFYSPALYTFNNNIWQVPFLMRIQSTLLTLAVFGDWGIERENADFNTKRTFSCYSVSLKTLLDADFWNTKLGADDTIFYWRAFFARNGDFKGVSHYLPVSADAVQGRTYWQTHKSQYKQLLRWGYGIVDVPLSIKGFLTNKDIPLEVKIAWVMRHLQLRVFLTGIIFLITFGFTAATFINPDIKQMNFAYSLPTIMSIILTFTMIFLIPSGILRSKLSAPMPEDWPLWKKFLAVFDAPFIILHLLTYATIPYLDAQTRLMFGKKLKDLYHTPKVRKDDSNS